MICFAAQKGKRFEPQMEHDMNPTRISFEFFPPAGVDAAFRLAETVQALAPMGPEFVSVTYGASGGDQGISQDAITAIQRSSGLDVAGHLTCVGASREAVLAVADAYHDQGVRRIVALRGDAPKGAVRFAPHSQGFENSVELVDALARTGKFDISVGAYPERHPDAADPMADVRWLKRKVDAGANRAITQFFFDAETFLRFRDDCVAAGIHVPVIPGILPIQNWQAAKRFAARCGARVPGALDRGFSRAVRDGREDLYALAHSVALCDRLRAEGVEDLHFYTLNRAPLVLAVLEALGLVPARVGLARVA